MASFPGIRFIGFFQGIPLDGNFILRDLPGSGKRIDVLCRSLAACFDWAPEYIPRSNLEFIAILTKERMLIFRSPPNSIKKGESWWARIVRDVLTGNEHPFVTESNNPVEYTLKEIGECDKSHLYVLDERGTPLTSILPITEDSQYSFMLGNHLGFDEPTQEIIRNLSIPRIKLGNLSYLGSHCIASVISHFERMVI